MVAREGWVPNRRLAAGTGGKLTMWSKPGSGTEVELTIPASVAYAKPVAPRGQGFGEEERNAVERLGAWLQSEGSDQMGGGAPAHL